MSGELAAKVRRTYPSHFGVSALTSREIQVLRLLALWYTRREVAEALYISEHTVIAHTRHICTKLGVNSLRAAIHAAMENNILELSCSAH